MKSKASYFSISKPLIIENMRRFWAIPALAFLVYFLSGVFPILMSYSHLNDLSDYIKMSLTNQQPFFMFAHLMFPIVTAVVLFRYLQGISSVSVMHSMPFTRAKLYNSGFLSGLILISLPILVNGLILLAISKPVFSQYDDGTGLITDTIDLFTRAGVLNWIWTSLIITFVIYAVSIFAGVITGNSLMHFATAGWFNFLIPALYAVFIAYFDHFLYGFNSSGSWVEFGLKISPYLNVFKSNGVFGLYSTIYYIICFFALFAISGFLYQKRRLEHATDSLAFGFMEPIICHLIAFLGMTLLGFYFQVLGETEFYMYAGLAAGTIIFFIIGQMIVKKTPRIYTMQSLKSFAIYSLIAIVFILGLKFDVAGFETRVPNPDNISSVTFSEDFIMGTNYSRTYVDGYPLHVGYGDGTGFRLKDPENIKAITELHRMMAENKAKYDNLAGVYSSALLLRYNPDATLPINREYQIDYDSYRNSKEFKQIYESKEYKDYYAPSNLNYVSLEDIYVNCDSPMSETVTIQSKTDMAEFLACVDKDFKAQAFADMISLKHSYATVEITFKYRDKNSDQPEKLLDGSVNYTITANDKNTIKWLDDHGYGDRFIQNVSEIEYIELYHYVGDNNTTDRPSEYSSDEVVIPANELDGLKITDPVKIQDLLNTYESQNINFNDYYYGNVVYKGDNQLQAQSYGDDYEEKMAEKYGTTDMADAVTMSIYFNEGNIPDYVLEYFK